MNSDAASLRQIAALLRSDEVDYYLTHAATNTRAKKTKESDNEDEDFTLQYNRMMWWRHFNHVNGVNWITTTEECRMEHEARTKRIKRWNHGTLQRMFGSYDDDSSDSDDGVFEPAEKPAEKHNTTLSPNSLTSLNHNTFSSSSDSD